MIFSIVFKWLVKFVRYNFKSRNYIYEETYRHKSIGKNSIDYIPNDNIWDGGDSDNTGNYLRG